MDTIETIDTIFDELYQKLHVYTKSKHNRELKKEIERVKLCIIEVAGGNCIDTDKIIESISGKNMFLE